MKLCMNCINYELLDCVTDAVLEYESLYLSNLPDAEYYEKSYMHRDVISHIVVAKYVCSWFDKLCNINEE
jgi:hypothetical protein